jgi:hypothetical protein
MKTLLAALVVSMSLPVFAQVMHPGECVPRKDPLMDGFCGRFPDKSVCESYPMCVWKEKQSHNTSSQHVVSKPGR